jgi:hypothetical protein
MNLETLIQNMDPKKILTLIYNSSEEVQEEFVERFEKIAKNLSKKRKVQEEEEQKELKANELQITQTRLSLKEFEDRLKQKLPNDRIQQLLRMTKCRKLYRFLYGDTSKIDVTQDDILDPKVQEKEGNWDEEGSFRASPEEYVQIFISILKRINTPKAQRGKREGYDDRWNFHTFTDICWKVVNFDTLSTGIQELVFKQDTCPVSSSYSMENLLKPNQLRELCIDHIKAFFFSVAELGTIEIDAAIRKQLDDEFKGVGIILIFISNFLFKFHVHNWI